jgi:tyrosyl-DNA phosphodiesterase 1
MEEKNKEPMDVIDLLDDDDDSDTEEDKLAAGKRALVEDDSSKEEGVVRSSPKKKKHQQSVTFPLAADDTDEYRNTQQRLHQQQMDDDDESDTPIKLFATSHDEHARTQHRATDNGNNSRHWSWSQCRTLREMLRIDDSSTTIDWLVIANYMIDFDYMLDEIPELLSVKHVVIVYGIAVSDPLPWKNACSDHHTVDFICLRPSDPAGSPHNPLPYCIPYGVHHSKLFLVGYSGGTCRVVIHTANLMFGDIRSKAQAAYVQDFCFKTTTDSTNTTSSSEFEDTLVAYMDSYCYRKPQTWLRGGQSEPLTTCLRRYDFSTARAVLIPSIPGYHKLVDTVETFGHWKLRQSIARHTPAPVLSANTDQFVRPIVCQFSSIGSLTEKYLRDLQISMDTGLARIRDATIPASSIPLRLQLVYPTVTEIRDSIQGYVGGGSVPGTIKNVSKPFLRPLFRKWSTANSVAAAAANPLCRPTHVPHIKTYYQVSPTGDSMEWLLVTSHNLSKAAWGEVQTSQRYGGRRLFVRHWELGVLVTPSTLQVDRLVYWTPTTMTNGGGEASTSSNVPTRARVPMPYKLYYPEPYNATDRPWAVDATYSQADSFGRHSAHD